MPEVLIDPNYYVAFFTI